MKKYSLFEGTIFVDDVNKFFNKLKNIDENITIMDADKLADESHVRLAVEKALKAFERGDNIANELSKEIMLYASGTSQINKAMNLGIHKGENNVVVVYFGKKPELEIIPKNVLSYGVHKKKVIMELFNITDDELEAVGDERIPELVMERVVLVMR